MIPASASSPSVSAAGPGCRISVDLISRSQPVRTAGICVEARPGGDLRRHEFLAAPGADDDVGRGRDHVASADTMRSLAFLRRRAAGTPRCRRRPRSAPTPSRCRRSSARPIPRNRPAAGAAVARRARARRRRRAASDAASASALSGAPTSAPSVRIMSKMPATSRWLKACTATLARISSATMSACRSEKVSTRSGLSARIFGTSARDEGRDARLLLAHLRRAHRIAGDADDAALLAEEIERLHGLLGQADDALGREHAPQSIRARRRSARIEQFQPAGRRHAAVRRAAPPCVAMRCISPAWWLT